MAQKGKSTSVYLYPDTEAVLASVAKHYGLENISAALRLIVTDWARYEGATRGIAPTPAAPPAPAAAAETKEN